MDVWRWVQKDLRAKPIVAGPIGGAAPLFAERYILHSVDRVVRGVGVLALVTQFGGARVREGEVGRWRTATLPSQSLLVPRRCATHWHYGGTADFAVFYLTDETPPIIDRLVSLTRDSHDPLLFSDALVGAAALQIMTEMAKGQGADPQFLGSLVGVMLEQTYRILSAPNAEPAAPRNIHLSRLQKVLTHINEHLSDDLRAQTLAEIAGVSTAHFRRLFHEANGTPLHRYILTVRLDQARTLLATTGMPIFRIAQECGFSSQSHLTAQFKAAHAATPAEYRANVQRGSKTRSSGDLQ